MPRAWGGTLSVALVISVFLVAVPTQARGKATEPASLTVYTIPAPWGLSWRSPRAMFLNRVLNEFALFRPGRKIGHVAIELKTKDGTHRLTGMTSDFNQAPELFKHGYGLRVMLKDYPGRFERDTDLRPELKKRYQRGNVSYLRFQLNDATAARLKKYLNEFDARDHEKHYGGPNRPRHGEGGGCSAFGASMIDVAGMLSDRMQKAWTKTINLPKALIGGPGTDRHVSPWRLFGKLGRRWAREDEPHTKLTMFDPTMMAKWVKDAWRADKRAPNVLPSWAKEIGATNVTIEKRGRAKGVVIDARNVPAPKDPIWL